MPAAVLAVVAALLAVNLVDRLSARPSGTAAPPEAAQQQPDIARRLAGDPRAQGELDAPVVMVMWSDFQCPFCGRFARDTQPQLVTRYVDTGILRIEWRDFPYIGPESLQAAVAGRAAAAQGRFWEFGEAVYGQERRPRSDDFDSAHLRAYAEQAGLNLAEYDSAVATQAGSGLARAELAEATDLGVTGTPAFLINGSPVIGAAAGALRRGHRAGRGRGGAAGLVTVGYAVAFLGGILSLASPCSAFLLPSFFAYAFPSTGRLVSRTLLFYLGLVLTLVPLGLGSGAASRLVYGHREALFASAGAVLIALGVWQAAGRGFRIPGADRLRARSSGTAPVAVVALGAATGLTGFCTGPILGAVLTVAATSGSPLRGGSLLAVYAAGMAAPLLLLALGWERLRLGERRWLRGRPLLVGAVQLHSTSLLGGAVVIGIGLLFLLDRGGSVVGAGLLSIDSEARVQEAVTRIGPDGDVVALAAIGVAAAVALLRARRKAVAAAGGPEDRDSASDGTPRRRTE